MTSFLFVTVEPYPIAYVHRTCASEPEAIGATMQDAMATLTAFMDERGVESSGPPISIFHSYDEGETTFDCAMPIGADAAAELGGDDDVEVGETYGGHALKAIHHGPYVNLADTYKEVFAQLEQKHVEPIGPSWEVYVTDPRSTPEDELVTEIYVPAGNPDPDAV